MRLSGASAALACWLAESEQRVTKTKTSPTDKVWLTPREAAEYTGIGRTRLYALLRTKTIPSALVGRTRHIRRTDLDSFLEQRIDAGR